MKSKRLEALAENTANIERWIVPLLLLLVVTVGGIRLAPWLENHIPQWLSGAPLNETNPTQNNSSDSSIIVDTELAPIITDNDTPLSESRSEQLTEFLSEIKDSPSVDIAIGSEDTILVHDVTSPDPSQAAATPKFKPETFDSRQTAAATAQTQKDNTGWWPRPTTAETKEATSQKKRIAEKDRISQTLNSWAKKWSEQNVEAYLNHYTTDYSTQKYASHQKWRKWRRARILHPKTIEIILENVEINLNEINKNRASATFLQKYRADQYADDTIKSIGLVRQEARWLIYKETSIETIRK